MSSMPSTETSRVRILEADKFCWCDQCAEWVELDPDGPFFAFYVSEIYDNNLNEYEYNTDLVDFENFDGWMKAQGKNFDRCENGHLGAEKVHSQLFVCKECGEAHPRYSDAHECCE